MSEKKIECRFENVDGTIDLDKFKIVCVCKEKYATVDLCIKANMNIPIASIKLYDQDLWSEAEAAFESASLVGKEIERRLEVTESLTTELAATNKGWETLYKETLQWEKIYKKARLEIEAIQNIQYELEDAMPRPDHEVCESRECGGCKSDKDEPCEPFKKHKKEQLEKLDAICQIADVKPYTKLTCQLDTALNLLAEIQESDRLSSEDEYYKIITGLLERCK